MSRVHKLVPEPVTGYLLSPGESYFSVILPEEGINLCTVPTPSISLLDGALGGYLPIGPCSAARYNGKSRRGAWSVQITPVLNPALQAIRFDHISTTMVAGRTYTWSFDFFASPGNLKYRTNIVGTGTYAPKHFVSTGKWQRVSYTFTAQHTERCVLYVVLDHLGTEVFYVDGLQLENKPYATTYIDGDLQGFLPTQKHYFWLGKPHFSASMRSSACVTGGRVVNLSKYGFETLGIVGLGNEEISNLLAPYAYIDGDEYQTSRAAQRVFTLAGTMFGRKPGDLQRKRSDLIDILKSERVSPRQPVVLRANLGNDCSIDKSGIYTRELDILALYDGGLQGSFDNYYQERVGLQFVMPKPYLQDTGCECGVLTDVATSTGNYVEMRYPNGTWDALDGGASGGATPSILKCFWSRTRGTVYFTGSYTTLGGHAAITFALGYYNPVTDDIVLDGALFDDLHHAMCEYPDGTLYLVGDFTTVDGVTCNRVAVQAGAAGTAWAPLMDSGTHTEGCDDKVYTCAVDIAGDLYVGGIFHNAGGHAATHLARWDKAASTWNACGNPDGDVWTIVVGPDQKVYVGGAFANVGGVAANKVACYDPVAGTWSALGTGLVGGSLVCSLAFGADGRLYAAGNFTTPSRMAVWNGASWETLGAGLSTPWGSGTFEIYDLYPTDDGKIYMAGDFSISAPNYPLRCQIAYWDGSVFKPVGYYPPLSAGDPVQGRSVCVLDTGQLFFSFDGAGANSHEWATDISNSGTADAHPIVVIKGIEGPHYILLKNLTTKEGVYMSPNLTKGGRVVIDMTPGNIRVTDQFGNVINAVMEGSDLATFHLIPGTNRIVLFVWSALVTDECGMYWMPQYKSLDNSMV